MKLRRPQSFVSKCESRERRLDGVELQAFGRLYKKSLPFGNPWPQRAVLFMGSTSLGSKVEELNYVSSILQGRVKEPRRCGAGSVTGDRLLPA